MTQQRERQVLLWAGVAFLALAVVLFVLTVVVDALDNVWEPLFVLALGLGCQCFIRFFLTTNVQYDHDRLFVTTSGWFQKNKLDKWLIKKDPVMKWADLSDYDTDAFLVVPGQRELTVQHTCTLELLNLLAAVFAYLPLVMIIPADRKVEALLVLLVPAVLFSAWAVFSAVRARHYRFQVKAGRA